jgi:hypothetical protein
MRSDALRRPAADIAGVDPKTLQKHYRNEVDLGATKATAEVAEFLFCKARTEGPQCVTAAIFWMKARGGWREAPLSHEIAVKPASEMSDAEFEARIRELDVHVTPLLELRPVGRTVGSLGVQR